MQNIEAIERRLWSAADQLRGNSEFASNEYFLPIMGLIFLRHAYSRYLRVKGEIEVHLPTRGGKTRPLTKEDLSQKTAIYLRPKAQFDYLVGLSDDKDRAQAVVDAMDAIEEDYETLKGVLPKQEYQVLDNVLLGRILRVFDDAALKSASGDVFGRIYEYFLTQFADQGAHDNGEFFTPVSLVQMIVNVIEPDHGKVIDPACGSGGMFVQSAHFIENQHGNPTEAVTFYGQEKNPTTIRLAKMNLAVHGLEGDVLKGITYYEDNHEMLGKADFVMANPPFNVDEVDADKVKGDPRLPFGLPGVNKKGAVSNGNYLWISYFYSYLNDAGRAGFVMSSQASSAGRDELKVRQKLIETGHVDAMIAIRPNFFYTRSVPCDLWFFDKNKPEANCDKVLMIDARGIYRKVTRKIYDFSPEQLKNLTSIVWLYRGEKERFMELLQEYLDKSLLEANGCFLLEEPKPVEPLPAFVSEMEKLLGSLPAAQANKLEQAELMEELHREVQGFRDTMGLFEIRKDKAWRSWNKSEHSDMASLKDFADTRLAPLAETSRDLVKDADLLYKLATRVIEACEKDDEIKESEEWKPREIARLRKDADSARKDAVEQLKLVRYFYKQAHWLQERFPDAELRDVPGLVKLVDREEIENNDWNLTPGRYVGIAPEEVDEEFDFEEALREIHVELQDLNTEAVELAATIARNFEELGA
jgi:type I restriction enzyme M protein